MSELLEPSRKAEGHASASDICQHKVFIGHMYRERVFIGQVKHPSKGWKTKQNLREEMGSPCIRFGQHFKEIAEFQNKKEVTF